LLPKSEVTNGHADLVTVSNHAPATASVLLGRGDGTFGARVDYPAGASDSFPSSVAVGDFNRDGHLDLAVTEYYTPTTGQVGFRRSVAVLLGRGDGTFASPVEYPTGPGPTSVVVGDLNGDGTPRPAAVATPRPAAVAARRQLAEATLRRCRRRLRGLCRGWVLCVIPRLRSCRALG